MYQCQLLKQIMVSSVNLHELKGNLILTLHFQRVSIPISQTRGNRIPFLQRSAFVYNFSPVFRFLRRVIKFSLGYIKCYCIPPDRFKGQQSWDNLSWPPVFQLTWSQYWEECDMLLCTLILFLTDMQSEPYWYGPALCDMLLCTLILCLTVMQSEPYWYGPALGHGCDFLQYRMQKILQEI